MANYLKMDKKQQIYGLLQLGWSYRRIEKETGVRRETVSRYHREWLLKAAKVPTGSGEEPLSLEANAAISPAGLPEGRSTAAPYHSFIEDLAGNSLLSFESVFIKTEGQANPYVSTRPLKNLFSPKSTRVLRFLLDDPKKE